jgi:pyruvoyl-dependent arginine decarboxylase (PvlArgDC)
MPAKPPIMCRDFETGEIVAANPNFVGNFKDMPKGAAAPTILWLSFIRLELENHFAAAMAELVGRDDDIEGRISEMVAEVQLQVAEAAAKAVVDFFMTESGSSPT